MTRSCRIAVACGFGLLLFALGCKPKEPTLILPQKTYPDPGPAVGIGGGGPPKQPPATPPQTKPDTKPPA